ncbi:hypothetical protein AKJ09_05794 [Labilithrix luteola]|uniref:Uncharacterized protein n=1 Tax=Labilithrix luteola TaxID=1391654 RepID=A0A0K1Q019_9BACT|nr:hypothetical protein AKJ09_05794 [Labilithrix luteola]
MQWALGGLACSALLVVACGDDEATVKAVNDVDAGAEVLDSGSAEPLADAGDASDAADAFVPCGPGDEVKTTVGDGGATLSLCGATLEVPEGALEAGSPVGIAVVAAPAAPWFDHELSGPVFRFTPDDIALELPAKIGLTRDTTKARGPVLARWLPVEKEWGEHEGCLKDDVLSLETIGLGTFGLMQDVNTYPPAASGLGTATVSLDLGGVATSWTVPGNGGYAVYEPGVDGRSFMLVARRTEGDDLEALDIRGVIQNNQPSGIVQVSWLTTAPDAKSWSWVEPIHGPATSFTMTETSPGTYTGELHVVGHYGDETTEMGATFTMTPGKFRPPPSYSCGHPEGDPR